MLDKLIRLSEEVQKIDADIKESWAAEKIVQKAEKMGCKVSQVEGFHEKLRIKMDAAVQRLMEKLDEKDAELDTMSRSILCMSSEAPTAENSEEDSKMVSEYCTELKAFLQSDRSVDCPKMTLPVEQAVQRLLNNPV